MAGFPCRTGGRESGREREGDAPMTGSGDGVLVSARQPGDPSHQIGIMAARQRRSSGRLSIYPTFRPTGPRRYQPKR